MENNTTAEQTTTTTVIESTTQEQKTEKEEIERKKITKTEEIRIAKSQQIPIKTISRVQPTRDPKLDSQYDASELFTDDEETTSDNKEEESIEPTTEETSEEIVEPTEETSVETPSDTDFTYDGPVLTATKGINNGPSGKETYYNLPMSTVVSYMRSLGYSEEEYPYWIRDDGCKMLGDYIIVAADLSIRPKGTILPCSLGMAIVCDTGGFAKTNHEQLDIAVTW